MKIKTIKLEAIAKVVSSDPKMFMEDLATLHAKFWAFGAKYGDLGLKTLFKMLSQGFQKKKNEKKV